MPFSFFAARCIYVAQQPLKYRIDVIKRIYAGRLLAHTGLITAVKGTEVINFLPALI